MKDLIPTFAGLIFPPSCLFCNAPGHDELDICESCLATMPFIDTACRRCALPLPPASLAMSCGSCLQKTPSFDDAVSVFEYRDHARELVTRLKFHAELPVARTLGDLLWKSVREQPSPDVLLPVPLHSKRLRERGFNQAVVIADMLNRHTEVEIWRSVVRRTRETPKQTGLDARQRRQNLRGAFSLAGRLDARHVAIIDDVVTTGSTVEELATLLKKNGVETVSVWSIARATRDL